MKYINMLQNTARKLANMLISVLLYISQFLLCAIIIVGGVDVFGRHFFNRPLKGSGEIIEILLVSMFFMGLPIVTYQSQHIKVPLLERKLPHIIRYTIQIIVHFIFILGMTLISNRLWDMSERYERRHTKTAYLEIPMEYLSYLAIVGCYLVIILLILKILSNEVLSNHKEKI